jgi:hypothetical protein
MRHRTKNGNGARESPRPFDARGSPSRQWSLATGSRGERARIAAFHQFGAGENPERRMVDPTFEDKREWDHIVVSWPNELRRGVFGVAR